MLIFRTILVAADLSESSREAFRVACSLAREDKTRVFVLSVLEPKYVPETPVSFGEQAVHYTLVARDPSEYASMKERLREVYAPDQPLDVEYQTTEGDAAEEILRSCDEMRCDLIVMGTHGRTGLWRLLAGSVAEAVLRRARCPVLALRESETPRKADRDEVILHPTDFSECSERALRTARALAQDRGSRLILLHVMPLETVIYGTVPVPLDVRAVRDSLATLASGVDGPDLKYPVATRVTQGDAAAEIVRVAGDEPGCGLIVMGTHGRSGLGRLLMGSVAEAVLRSAACPVLTVKNPHPGTSPARGEPCPGGVAV
jgi:nucleotide-binding universal stress UspA family protein